MKRIVLFSIIFLAELGSFAQVQTLPNSIGIGTGINSSIPLHINKNGEVARFQGTWPYVTLYDGLNLSGYVQAINSTFEIGSKSNFDLNFFTGDAPRLNINGITGMATFYQKLVAQNGIKLTGPLQAQGESVGANGMILVSKGNATPAWEDKNLGFKVYTKPYEFSKSNTQDKVDSLSVGFNDGNMINPLEGIITIPSSGLYSFTCKLRWEGCISYSCNNVILYIELRKNELSIIETIYHKLNNAAANENDYHFPFTAKFEAGDRLTFFYTFYDSESPRHNYSSSITGYKIY